MPFLRMLSALCIPTIVGACGAVAPRGIVEAARLDPLNTAPEEMGIAVAVPDTIVLNDGDAIVRLAFSVGGDTVVDARVPHSVERASDTLPDTAFSDDTVYAAFLTPQNAATLAAAQADIRTLLATGTTGEGTLSIAVIGGCRTGEPLETLYVSTWLRASQSASYVPLTRRRDVLGKLGGADMVMPPCGR